MIWYPYIIITIAGRFHQSLCSSLTSRAPNMFSPIPPILWSSSWHSCKGGVAVGKLAKLKVE